MQAVAQILTHIVVFLIFMYVLKILAWKPVLKLLDERRTKIESEFQRIEELEKQIDELRDEYKERIQNIENEGRQKIRESIHDARRIAREITDNALAQSQDLLDRARQSIDMEASRARAEFREEIVKIVFQTTEKLLRERIDEEKHRELVETFIKDLRKN